MNRLCLDSAEFYERIMGRMGKIFYLLIRGNVEYNHEDDEWLGIYDSVEKLYSVYKRAVQGLEEERKAYEEKFGEPMDSWTLRNEKILINSFDEYSGEWKHGIAPEEIFADMNQIECENLINDEILDSEVKFSEFEKRNDKEKIIESVMGKKKE